MFKGLLLSAFAFCFSTSWARQFGQRQSLLGTGVILGKAIHQHFRSGVLALHSKTVWQRAQAFCIAAKLGYLIWVFYFRATQNLNLWVSLKN